MVNLEMKKRRGEGEDGGEKKKRRERDYADLWAPSDSAG
jgi:hypothetical protein